jgi:dihydropyrimidinase
MSILIRGGRIVTAADDYVADVFVDNEHISLIGESLDVDADRVIDAAGKLVLPGLVDPHTHMEIPFGGTETCDNFTDGTISAAFGGVTTIVDFCLQQPGQTFSEALETWHGKIETNKPVVDVGFHIAITDLKEFGTLEDLARTPEEGVTSYKLFMAYKGAIMIDDETLFKSMRVAAESGSIVMVHAENGDAIDVLVKDALAAGNTSPRYHALTRPPETEGEATNRAIQLSHVADCPLYVVHVSCTDAIDPIARARDAGWKVHGETCPQYLFIDFSHIDQPGFEGANTRRRRARSTIRRRCGRRSGRTRSRSSRPTTRRSSSSARRISARTTSRRSRTGPRGSRSGSSSCTPTAWARAGSTSTGSSS